MVDVNSVPARIVIIGTSKISLSQRFSQFSDQKENIQIIHRPNSFNDEVIQPIADQHLNYRRGPPEKAHSFLFDNYMENDLFGRSNSNVRDQYSNGQQFARNEQQFARDGQQYARSNSNVRDQFVNRQQYAHQNGPNGFVRRNPSFRGRLRAKFPSASIGSPDLSRLNFDPLNSTLDEVITLRNARPRRRALFKPRSASYSYGQNPRFLPPIFDDDLDEFVPPNAPIQERLSVVRLKKPNFRGGFIRKPFRTTGWNMGRPFVGRSKRNFKFNRNFNKNFRNGSKFGRNSNNDGRSKMTLEELDKELEEYMKANSAKHPRITTSSAE